MSRGREPGQQGVDLQSRECQMLAYLYLILTCQQEQTEEQQKKTRQTQTWGRRGKELLAGITRCILTRASSSFPEGVFARFCQGEWSLPTRDSSASI